MTFSLKSPISHVLTMMKQCVLCHNQYMGSPRIVNPINQIHSGPRWFSDPERLLQHKMLYFYLGVDTLPIRRVSIIQNETHKMRMVPTQKFSASNDPTGYRRSRLAQMKLWYKRCMYQEWWLQHLYTRFAWGKCRFYPTNGGKIHGVHESGVWGYDKVNVERYSRQPLSAEAREIYDRRK